MMILRAMIVIGALSFLALSAVGARADIDHRYPFLEHARYADTAPRGRAVERKPDPALVSIVNAAAWSAGISTELAAAVVRRESGWKAHARGAAGEYGLFQIKCQTARGLGFSGNCRELFDASTNAHWGAKHLAEAKARGGSTCAQITRHNAGLFSNYCSAYGRAIMRTAGMR